MGYMNYVSVYCDGSRLVDNYNCAGHPWKNSPYGVLFEDATETVGKQASVRIRSCENRIYFVFANQALRDFSCRVDDADQMQHFEFTVAEGLLVVFLENQYVTSPRSLLYNDIGFVQMSTKYPGRKIKMEDDFAYVYMVFESGTCVQVTDNNWT